MIQSIDIPRSAGIDSGISYSVLIHLVVLVQYCKFKEDKAGSSQLPNCWKYI